MTPHLPTEVLVAIAEVTRRKDLLTLRRVSARFNAVVTPLLFASLRVGRITDSMWEGFTDEVRPLHIFERVKHLEFRKSIREGQIDLRVFGTPERVRFSGGAELQLGEGDNDVDSDVDSDMIQRGNNHRLLEQRLRALLERLEKNTLLQFSWNVGDFIPAFMLGGSGYLPTRQCRLRTLYLDTSTLSSMLRLFLDYFYNLTKFHSLVNLSWRIIRGKKQRSALCRFLRSNCHIVESLSLEIEPHKRTYEVGSHQIMSYLVSSKVNPSGSNASDLSSLPDKYVYCRLPLLQVLSLTGFSFEREMDATKILHALNIGHLRSLKLRQCKGAVHMLYAAVQMGLPINLVSLELDIDDMTQGPSSDDSALIPFLETCRGIRDLFLKTRHIEHYWHPIAAHHKQSLKRFVAVERDERRFGGFWQDSSADAHLSGLQCFGLYAVPSAIKRTLLYAQLRTLQVLHIRLAEEKPLERLSEYIRNAAEPQEELQSDSRAFLKFANWAFDEGLPNLRVLALGIFTDPDSRKGYLLLARRDLQISPPGNESRHMEAVLTLPYFVAAQDQTVFEATTVDDEGIFTNISDPLQFLGACP